MRATARSRSRRLHRGGTRCARAWTERHTPGRGGVSNQKPSLIRAICALRWSATPQARTLKCYRREDDIERLRRERHEQFGFDFWRLGIAICTPHRATVKAYSNRNEGAYCELTM